jgi:hypothetical protein
MNSNLTLEQESLRRCNHEINEADIRGDREVLAAMLAPLLAFQRADPAMTVDDRDDFLRKAPEKRGDRAMRVLDPIQVFGNRAVVQCVVTQNGHDYHNLRLFVKRDGAWKLLGWANEPL